MLLVAPFVKTVVLFSSTLLAVHTLAMRSETGATLLLLQLRITLNNASAEKKAMD